MAIYAVIDQKTNDVVNMIEWDGVNEWQPPQGCFLSLITEDVHCKIGDCYDDLAKTFYEPKR